MGPSVTRECCWEHYNKGLSYCRHSPQRDTTIQTKEDVQGAPVGYGSRSADSGLVTKRKGTKIVAAGPLGGLDSWCDVA